MNKKLRLIKRDKLDYMVPVPERLKQLRKAKIRIKFIDGEYQYIPSKHTFGMNTRLTSDELELISDELKRLNK